MFAAVISSSLALTSAAPTWSASHTPNMRRLGLVTASSHTDKADAGCIVGGYDADNPAHIYIGGPCSGLKDDNTPTDDFRWIEMMTVGAEVKDTAGNTFEMTSYGDAINNVKSETTHVEVGVGTKVHAKDEKYNRVAMFLSTTSYLSKGTFSVTTNNFVVGKDQTVEGVCITKCCETPPCECSSCSDTHKLEVTPGQYKYSLLGAALDETGEIQDWTAYSAGSSGNGWHRLVADKGTEDNGNKILKGNLVVYQVIDFTNMKADTLTITPPTGNSVMYKDMKPCDKNAKSGCTFYGVKSMTVQSQNWAGSYSFPLHYNVGSYENTEGGKITPKISGTKVVEINCVRFNDASLEALGLKNKKAVFLEYKFDITKTTASESGGSFMAYDPTVTTGSKSKLDEGAASSSPTYVPSAALVAAFTSLFML